MTEKYLYLLDALNLRTALYLFWPGLVFLRKEYASLTKHILSLLNRLKGQSHDKRASSINNGPHTVFLLYNPQSKRYNKYFFYFIMLQLRDTCCHCSIVLSGFGFSLLVILVLIIASHGFVTPHFRCY